MATQDLSATTTITFEQLTKYFHLPINDVAKELGICATMLKKICRKNGIPRWPHRKIKSLNKMIENLEASLQNNATEAEECIRQEINILKNKKSLIMKNPSILVQGNSNKRPSTDHEGKALKKIKASEDDDVPVATITIPKSSIPPAASNSLSINQLLTPSNPFSTPLTSYLLSSAEEKDDKDSPRRVDETQLIARPPSPSSAQHYYKSQQQQQQQQSQQQASRYYTPQHNMPLDYHHRTSVEFLTSAPPHAYSQQAPQQVSPQHHQHQQLQQTQQHPQDSHYVLPKLNFSANNGTQQSYMSSQSPPKFRPPSPITSAHQQVAAYPTASQDGYSRHTTSNHFFHHYHPQLHSPSNYKMQPQSPQAQHPQQSPHQSQQYRWVMEYEKPGKK